MTDFALSRIILDASNAGFPVSLEVSSDGGKTWKMLPTQGASLDNNLGFPKLTWTMGVARNRFKDADGKVQQVYMGCDVISHDGGLEIKEALKP